MTSIRQKKQLLIPAILPTWSLKNGEWQWERDFGDRYFWAALDMERVSIRLMQVRDIVFSIYVSVRIQGSRFHSLLGELQPEGRDRNVFAQIE